MSYPSPYQDSPSPYQSPSPYAVPPIKEDPTVTPVVWYFFVAYCCFNALLCLGLLAMGVFLLVMPRLDTSIRQDELIGISIAGGFYIFLGLGFGIAYGIAPFLRRGKGAWIYGIVLIAFGMTHPCYWLATIPLMIFWVQGKTLRHFEYRAQLARG
ncbi:MAG TPA: hypothetical protein DCQ98_07800 [Planctomycetaceae bacterium]|nr:hypothetical protein [Planctomycetaceae bacterium]HRF00543.1 hypothetical protein [Pirellulaceae bacterium]